MYHDIGYDAWVLKAYSKAITYPPDWKSRLRTDLILYDYIYFTAEYMQDVNMNSTIETTIHRYVLSIVKDK